MSSAPTESYWKNRMDVEYPNVALTDGGDIYLFGKYHYLDGYVLEIYDKSDSQILVRKTSKKFILDDSSAKKEMAETLCDVRPKIYQGNKKEVVGYINRACVEIRAAYEQYTKKIIAAMSEKETDINQSILIENYIRNVELFYKKRPFFYDKSDSFWMWNENKYEMVREVELMNMIDDMLGFMGQTVTSKLKANYVEAFKRVGSKKIPKEAPKKWVQFKDTAFSIESGNKYKVTPDYFFTNPIPWEIGRSEETPIIDKLITEWVGEEFKQTAYEVIAYCCYSDYPIHTVVSLIGSGCNGKSKFLGVIRKFIGMENICSTELDTLLDSRFECAKMYKKLVCTMGETNFGVMSKTSLLKKLTGQDLIGYEFKNKRPFDDYNYAKIIIASNSLPPSTDTSDGFYRRWLILSFDNQFTEGRDILEIIDEKEYRNLAFKCCVILKSLLEAGKFSKQGTIQERAEKYILASNPLSFFIKTHCTKRFDACMRYSELYLAYTQFLLKNKKRKIGYKEFNDVLAAEGLEVIRTSKEINGSWISGRYIEGVELMSLMSDMSISSLSSPIESLSENVDISDISDTKKEETVSFWQKMDKIHQKCHICGSNPCDWYNQNNDKFYCDACKIQLT